MTSSLYIKSLWSVLSLTQRSHVKSQFFTTTRSVLKFCFEILLLFFARHTLNNFWIWRIFSELFFFLSRASSNSSFITFKSIFEEFLKSAFRKSFRIENISIFKDFGLISYFSVVLRQPLSSNTFKINFWRDF